MNVTYKITPWLILTTEDLDDIILGSGALSYPWWLAARGTAEHDGAWIITSSDPDDRDSAPVTLIVTPDMIVKAMRAIIRKDNLVAVGVGPRQTIKDQILSEDIDADGADCVLQTAFFGEVIYA